MRLKPLLALVAAHCATAAQCVVTMYMDGDAREASSRLAGLCADRGAVIVEQDEYHVLCTREVSGMKGALAQALIGNSNSTTPELNVRFSILRGQDGLRVQASQWLQTQMAFGQVRRQQLEGKADNEMRVALRTIGARDSVAR